jgi:ribosomal protein L40E
MDGDLFQYVLLGLLAVGVIVLVALLTTLGGIRKALENRAQSRPAGGLQPHADTAWAPEASSLSAAAQTTTPSGSTGQAATIRGVLEQHGLQDSQQATPSATAQPVQTQAVQAQPTQAQPVAQEAVVDSVFAAHADDPQEEPFQRDGRWWFKRGDELLLYDEASGQWQPAPADTGSASQPAAAPVQTAATTATAQVPVVADQVATFWKCPTCGAVNGSTAATCRMCFAARP